MKQGRSFLIDMKQKEAGFIADKEETNLFYVKFAAKNLEH